MKSPSQISSTTSSSYQPTDYANLNSQIATLIQNSQLTELSQFLSSRQVPKSLLTQFLSSLIDNSQNIEIIKLLLSKGANVNAVIHSSAYQIEDDEGITLLMYSIIANNFALFDIVMSFHPDILLTDSYNKNAVVYSILFNENGNMFLLLKLLTENKEAIHTIVTIDNVVHNLISLSTAKNKKNFVEVLLNADIDVNYQTKPGMDTALHLAVKNDNVEIAELIYHNAKFNKETKNAEGKTGKALAKELRGKVYYNIFAREHDNNKENVQINANVNVVKSKNENQRKKNKINAMMPIELLGQNLSSLLYIGEDSSKLCININQSSEELNEEIEKIKKTIKEKMTIIANYQTLLKDKESSIANLKKTIEIKDAEIQKYKKNTSQQRQAINVLSSQINDLDKLIKNQSDPSSHIHFLSNKFNSENYNDTYIVKCLQKDLTDYQAYVREIISHKRPVIDEIIGNIQQCVDEINPEYKVHLYGSYSTGLCLPWSDIDVVLINQNDHHSDEYLLSKLYMKLTQRSWVKTHKFIETTNIPIIKLVANDIFQFHIDISVQCDRHFGLKCVELVKSYLASYSVLEPIVLALKTLLNNGSLNNPYTGGLSSYGLILMVVSFIQSEIDTGKFNAKSPTILGETFINVLGHYGIVFDFTKYVIITYPINQDIVDNEKDNFFSFGQNMHELIIVDPLNRQNNVAKSTFQYMNIKMAFMIAYMVAKEDCECGCHYDVLQNKQLGIEHCILKRIFNSVKRFSDANKQIY